LDSPAPAIEGVVKQSLERIEATYRDSGSSPPTLKELTTTIGKVPGVGQLSEALEFLCMEGILIKITADMFFHTDALERIRGRVADHFQASDRLTVPAFKELVGASRKYAVPVLEYLDRIGVTRRVGDFRAPGRQLR
jgi:selenocysteine-specific elongation factor